ncbi:hypothetical protein EST38_g6605 [Candolleomyces aberdarensis]|uniref:Zn(2)-C6 fungal-type domain-containing protein n=1 Tax=Candolleomyces aberdarensis TaxID=2316362 RepID=A0A4V1Q3N8_9AGAR|nr:hypothetical protein EST38_g6605 [Candolleomyces aberdarensis]
MAPEVEYRFQNLEGPVKAKRRRLRGACDVCRHRKIRCDASEKRGQKCSNCISCGTECTHLYIAQKKSQAFRYHQDANSRGKSLAELQEGMDPLLKTILSGSYQAPTNPVLAREVIIDLARYARTLEAAVANGDGRTASTPSLGPEPSSSISGISPGSIPARESVLESYNKPDDAPAGDGEEISAISDTLANTLKRSLTLSSSTERFFGPSSDVALVDTTTLELEGVSRRWFDQELTIRSVKQHMRPEFWTVYPWEQPPPPENRPYDFPPPDLLENLVQLYYDCVNIYIPLLHRPTFEKSLKAGLHLTDPDFGGLVMGVCAVAARYSNDEQLLGDQLP